MSTPRALIDVSWEVGHKVGGVHTVLSTRAKTLVERHGDAYLAVGPWLLSGGNVDRVLEPDSELDGFAEGCRAAGVPVRAGRWLVPGRPRTLLVEFSGLFARKDDLLRDLWDRHRVDSLRGDWEYEEPVVFGAAAALVVERWWREFCGGGTGAVAQFHEWLSAAALLSVRDRAPEIATLFTCHSTVLGRALGEGGRAPADRLAGRTPEAAASDLGVPARHSIESAAARAADVLATVSEPSAEECAVFHGRKPEAILPNGIDLDTLGRRVAGVTRREARERLSDVAARLLGESVRESAILVSGGRYEFRNKGFDLLLEAAAAVNRRPGNPVVLFLFVPSGTSGVRHDVAARLTAAAAPVDPLAGVATHVLFKGDRDPVAERCARLGLTNAAGCRVRVLHVPAYLEGGDGVVNISYEAAVQGADLGIFPSAYDAWGYTPQECLALGVPAVTTDAAGFGAWCRARDLGPSDGVWVLERRGRTAEEARDRLADIIHGFLSSPPSRKVLAPACRDAVRPTTWVNLVGEHEKAFELALASASQRAGEATPPPRRGRRIAARSANQGDRPRVFPLEVRAELPAEIAGLKHLAGNWRWTWDRAAQDLFEALSPTTWAATRNNPLRTIREAPAADIAAAAGDRGFRDRLRRCLKSLDAYMAVPPAPRGGVTAGAPVAYVSAEFGIHECLPVYSGGLGVLAADHLRAASDLALPLVAVGILYRRGYFRQRLEGGVSQRSLPDALDPADVSLEPVVDGEGRPVQITIGIPAATLSLRAWKAQVGRIPLYLLDADLEGNRPEDRVITHHLYGGDGEYRIRQEIVLGRGAVRLLARLGIPAAVWHLNEGHGAFAPLERAAAMVRDDGLTFDEAREVLRASTLFTTHTPVPAGHDRFSEDLVRRYFSDVASWAGVPWDRFIGLGAAPGEPGMFNMTALALQFAGRVNGVSRDHGLVSRRLFRGLRPRLLPDEMPVGHVTNGVHLAAWTGPEIADLLGAVDRPVTGEDFSGRAADLDARALWEARGRARQRLLDAVRARLRRTFAERGDSPALLARILDGLDPAALVVGFARRFATYKRADLLLRDPARLRAILDGQGRPVRILLAGKAHPADAVAQEMLARMATLARGDEFAGRIVLLEDYDMGLARSLVQGADVWLNTPRPPMEASGTSGMKAVANGGLHVSVADGWWPEGYDGTNGWRIGDAVPTGDAATLDARDADSLYRLLEEEIVPEFFRRDRRGVPKEWVERVRNSLRGLPAVFDAARMVHEYAEGFYVPLAARGAALRAGRFAAARDLAERCQRVRLGMRDLRILSATLADRGTVRPGDTLDLRVEVDPGPLSPEDFRVEVVLGARAGDGDLSGASSIALPAAGEGEGGALLFAGTCEVPCVGSHGWAVRVRPSWGDGPPGLNDPVVWA